MVYYEEVKSAVLTVGLDCLLCFLITSVIDVKGIMTCN